MTNPILGIDISKKTFDVALLRGEKFKHKKFGNGEAGFKELSAWLARFEVDQLHVCMEATSSYGDALAEYLYEAGYQVSAVNPARIKGFAQGELMRTEIDKSDDESKNDPFEHHLTLIGLRIVIQHGENYVALLLSLLKENVTGIKAKKHAIL